ncbi:glycosyltransferase, partial [Amylibacter sp.]|nr:glycosyltransferase [Amylibacter sp.]
MPAFLSIVIPTLNSTKTIAPTLMSLSEGITTGLIKELIISDGNSTDAINEMCEEIGA